MKIKFIRTGIFVATACLLLNSPYANAQSAKEILEQDGFCIAQNISDDGKTIALSVQRSYGDIATSYDPEANHRPAIWREGSLIFLGSASYTLASSMDVSGDGFVVTGNARLSKDMMRALRWIDGQIETIGIPPFYTSSSVGVSSDGSAVIGHWYFDKKFTGFIWRGSEVTLIGEPNIPADVSGDGQIVVGSFLKAGDMVQASVWDHGRTYRPIKGVKVSEAVAVSDDGKSILVKYQRWVPHVESGIKLFRGDQEIDILPQGKVAPLAVRMSGNGKTISTTLIDPTDYQKPGEAVIWRAENDWRRETLKEVLEKAKIDATDWDLRVPTGLSYDGSIIVGNGKYRGRPTPWLIRLNADHNSQITPICN